MLVSLIIFLIFKYRNLKQQTNNIIMEAIIEKAKRKGFLGLTDQEIEKVKPHVKQLSWKDEGNSGGAKIGPVWVELTERDKDDSRIVFPYMNGKTKISGEDRHFAAWFKKSDAKSNAIFDGFIFQEV